MIFPNRLCKGDTIGVMAPAGLADLEDIKKAIPFLKILDYAYSSDNMWITYMDIWLEPTKND